MSTHATTHAAPAAVSTSSRSSGSILGTASSFLVIATGLLVFLTAFLGPERSMIARENLADGMVAATESGALHRAADGFEILETGKRVRIARGESLTAYIEPDGATFLHSAVCHYLVVNPPGAFAFNESVGYTVTELLPFSGERTLATVTSVLDPHC